MNSFKKFVSVLLALTLLASVFSACGKQTDSVVAEAVPAETAETAAAETEAPAQEAASAGYYSVGDKMDDFTITTYDGKEITLSKVLEEKDMVLVNLWATWCGPCGAEFPAMQEAYEQYQDKMEIIALSTAETDSDEILAAYAQEKGMTFCVGRDTLGLYNRIDTVYIPVSIVVDRFGVICAIEEGNVTDPAVFTRIFDMYTAEGYTQSSTMPGLQAVMSDVAPADPDELNAALNAEDGNLVFTNSSNAFYWPMTVEQKDGRTVAAASNVDHPMSFGMVETQVEAKAGDVLVMDYKLSSDYHVSVMRVTVDGKDVKVTSLEQDWTTFVYPFEEDGTHQVSVCFERSLNENEGKEGLWIDTIRLATGDEATQILENVPQYPVGEEFRFELLNENVEAAAIVVEETDELVLLVDVCADAVHRYEIVLDETMDPDTAYVMDVYNNVYPLMSSVNGDSYLVEIPCDKEFGNASVWLMAGGEEVYSAPIYASMEAVDVYAERITEAAGFTVVAKPFDESMLQETEPEGDGTYTVTYVDQNGDPVPGVICQVCDEATCQVYTSDANGVCQFTLPAGYYEIHTLMVPAGYEGDTTTITEAPVGGGELSFTLTKQ